MRLDINLASQPYEDSRQFWLRWGTGLAAAAILTIALLIMTVTGWLNARRDHKAITDLKAQIARRDQTRRQAEAFLNLPENRTTRDESQFLNELIERKSLSWTYVLEDLEKVMPARVHLVSIRPELDDDNQLNLKLVIAGDSRDKALDLARRMEDSRRFARTYIESETPGQSQAGDTVQFNIAGIYIPEAATAPTPPPTPATPTKRSHP